MKIVYKFSIIFIFLITVLCILSILLIWTIIQSAGYLEDTRITYFELLYLKRIDSYINRQIKEVADILLLKKEEELEEFYLYEKSIIDIFSEWKELTKNNENSDQAKLATILDMQQEYFDITKDSYSILNLYKQGENEIALAKYNEAIENKYESTFIKSIEEKIQNDQKKLNDIEKKTSKSAQTIVVHNISIFSLTIIIIIIIIILVRKSIIVPIIKLKNNANEISQGNLNIKINIKAKDEIGDLAVSIKKMVQSLESSFGIEYVHSRTNDYLDVVQKVAKGNYSKYCKESERNDIFDAVAIGINIMLDDIKEAEEKIIRINKELEKRVKERTIELENINNELESFSYSVSHDLRAPLRHITGFCKLFIEEAGSDLSGEARRYLNIIQESANNMGKLIDDLLSFSRVGRSELNITDIDLNELINKSIEIIEPNKKKKIKLNIAEFPVMQGDPSMIQLVMTNLITNAVKYTTKQKKPVIKIGFNKNEKNITVYIKDNGIGFDMEYSDKLFGVFQRLHSAEEYEGTGIGLAIVKRIIVRHKGGIWAEGKLNHGAVFYFSLPYIRK